MSDVTESFESASVAPDPRVIRVVARIHGDPTQARVSRFLQANTEAAASAVVELLNDAFAGSAKRLEQLLAIEEAAREIAGSYTGMFVLPATYGPKLPWDEVAKKLRDALGPP